MLADTVGGVGHLQVGGLDQPPDAVERPVDLRQLMLDRLQLAPLLMGQAVHLLIDHLDQFTDVAFGQDVDSQLLDDRAFEVARVEPGREAGLRALLDLRLADVVAVAAALGLGRRHAHAAGLAADEAREQVGAGDATRVDFPRRPRLEQPLYVLILVARDDGREGVLNPHGLRAVFGVVSPDEGAGVGLVAQEPVHGRLEPGLARRRGDAVGIERAGDVEHALTRGGHVEDAPHDLVHGRIEHQRRTLFAAVGDLDPLVAVGRPAGHPEPARGRFAHAARDLLGQVLGVELVDRLDDRLHQLAGRGVVGVLGDRGDADAAPPEHRLEGDGVLALAREAGELPDQDLLERRVWLRRLVQHLGELGPVGDPARLGFVDVLASDHIAVAPGVVAQGPELGGDREVNVLAVRGDAGIESSWNRFE
ncbi:MAG: hypothetical protein OXH19_07695 [Chloroflexi bacterium]|nr:hypothetical protein [Chloroflexota bacterium]